MADCILDLHPQELRPVIQKADQQGLLDYGILFNEEDIDRALSKSVDNCLEEVRQEMQRHSLDDLHQEMGSWASLRKGASQPYFTFPDKTKIKEQKAKQRSKKKAAKASRRKNRR